MGAIWVAAMFGVAAFGGPAGAGTDSGNCASYLYDTDLYLNLLGGPQVTVQPAVVNPGDLVTISLIGWEPDSNVDVVVVDAAGVTHTVGSVTVNGDSTAELVWVVPAGAAVGPATVQATGMGCLEVLTTVETALEVSGTPVTPTTTGTTGTLPVTGSNSSLLIGIGAACMVIGAAAVYGARRQRD